MNNGTVPVAQYILNRNARAFGPYVKLSFLFQLSPVDVAIPNLDPTVATTI